MPNDINNFHISIFVWPAFKKKKKKIFCAFGSSVALENPDFSTYPRAKCTMEHSQKVVLDAGDAIFIPEGW